MLEAAAALRWRRPRLTADLSHRVVETAAAAGDGSLWLRSAGWYLHGLAATEDAREAAVEILTSTDAFPGGVGIDDVDGARLRVELAAIAQSNGDVDGAQGLLGRPRAGATGGPPDELELDRVAVLVRCALAGPGGDLEDLRRSVEGIGRRLRAEPAALADLLVGSIHRSREDQRAASASALSGLANLGWTPEDPGVVPASPHLAAALFSQWITALLDGGAARDVAAAVRALRDQHERVDTGRQGLLLRLTLARAMPDGPQRTVAALRNVAERASRAGTPTLEAACRATEADVHEAVGEYREALAALRAGMVAERTDRDRGRRFRQAMAVAIAARAPLGTGTGPVAVPASGSGATPGTDGDRTVAPRRHRGAPAPAGSVQTLGPGVRRRPGDAGAGAGPTRADRRGREEGPTVDTGASADPGADGRAGDGAGVDGTATTAVRPPGAGDGAAGHLLEWVERSWYGPGRPGVVTDGDAPLADALVEELRTAASRRAVPARAAGDVEAWGGGAVVGSWGGADGVEPSGGDGVGAPTEPVRREPWSTMLPDARPVVPEPGVREPLNGHPGPAPEMLAAPTGTGTDRPMASPDRDRGRAAPDSVAELPGGPVVDVGDHLVVLDLRQGDRPARHPVAAAVLDDVAERAGRLVPPRGEIRTRGPHLDPLAAGAQDGAGPGRIEVALPDADRVTAMLWAQSLVGYVAARVGRNGLPAGTALRSQVHDASGPLGVGVVRELTGADRREDDVEPCGSGRPEPLAIGDSRGNGSDAEDDPGGDTSGRHGAPVPWAAGGVVPPGSGGRRRRDSPRPGRAQDDGVPDRREPVPARGSAAAPGPLAPGGPGDSGAAAEPGAAVDRKARSVVADELGDVAVEPGARPASPAAAPPAADAGEQSSAEQRGADAAEQRSARVALHAARRRSRRAQEADRSSGGPSADGSGATDSGATDSGATDSGATDKGATDGGVRDSGATDGGATDSGAGDVGAGDVGAGAGGADDGGSADRAVDPTYIPDDLGLAELLAGALAAYRDI